MENSEGILEAILRRRKNEQDEKQAKDDFSNAGSYTGVCQHFCDGTFSYKFRLGRWKC